MGDLRRRRDTQSTGEIEDRRLIVELLQNWVVWRDAGDWERFRAVWHPDGRMMATWTQGTGDEFIAISKEAWAKGVSILHFLGGISIDLAGDRAISQTKMTISQRAVVEGVEVDVLCTGRFYDFLEKRGGSWGIVLRQPIYEKDRMDPVHWAPPRRSTGPCLSHFRLATATSLICRPASAMSSRRTCPACRGRVSRHCTPAEPLGSQASRFSDSLQRFRTDLTIHCPLRLKLWRR